MARIEDERDGLIHHPRSEATHKQPRSPGAAASPQMPGMVPDRSSVPGHGGERVPPARVKVRPLSQYGTAEEIMKVFRRVPEAELKPGDFEQANASYEEVRKAIPEELPPERPSVPAIAGAEQPVALPAESSPATERTG